MPPAIRNNYMDNIYNGKLYFFFILIVGSIAIFTYCFISSHIQTLRKIDSIDKQLYFITTEVLHKGNFMERSNNQPLDYENDSPAAGASSSSSAVIDITEISDNIKKTIEDIIILHSQKLFNGFNDLKDILDKNYRTIKTEIIEKDEIHLRPNFALESLGAEIVSIGNTRIYENSWFNFVVNTNSQNYLLNPSNQPGECFAYRGQQANVTIKLMGYVFIDSVTIEHIPVELSPSGSIDTAPNEFEVFGKINLDNNRYYDLGKFNYDIRKQSTQIFAFAKTLDMPSFRYIEFRFYSNHGNKEHTCVYRIRVHGTLDHAATKAIVDSHSTPN